MNLLCRPFCLLLALVLLLCNHVASLPTDADITPVGTFPLRPGGSGSPHGPLGAGSCGPGPPGSTNIGEYGELEIKVFVSLFPPTLCRGN